MNEWRRKEKEENEESQDKFNSGSASSCARFLSYPLSSPYSHASITHHQSCASLSIHFILFLILLQLLLLLLLANLLPSECIIIAFSMSPYTHALNEILAQSHTQEIESIALSLISLTRSLAIWCSKTFNFNWEKNRQKSAMMFVARFWSMLLREWERESMCDRFPNHGLAVCTHETWPL